ncbi:MAG TPA: hypothetical protein PLD84_08320 [Chitinophagales bacterium]|nr:hypothetical protein [Chitinophagales bacterium]
MKISNGAMGLIFLAVIFFSCKKNSIEQNAGNAAWIKVMDDSAVYFPGKIRADAASNLFCSYNYRNYVIDSNSAIIKLDPSGNLLWRKQFDNLTIYDFMINPDGDVVIASYDAGMITLTILSSEDTTHFLLGAYPLPLVTDKIRDIVGMKISTTADGNYVISSTVFYRKNNERVSMGFIMEVTTSGVQLWMGDYFFPINEATTITGCAGAEDGYLLFGNVQKRFPAVSSFFVMKCDSKGDSLWTKFYETSNYTSTGPDSGTYHGYYCYTTDIISSGDNNFYACAYNEKYNLPNVSNLPIYTDDDNSARIMKISQEGTLIKSASLKHDFQNMAADLVRTGDNGLLIGLNPINLVGTYYLGMQSSFVARLNTNLDILSVSNIQTHYYDYLGSLCVTPDGHYAIETMIQSFGSESFLLEIIKTNENGNF